MKVNFLIYVSSSGLCSILVTLLVLLSRPPQLQFSGWRFYAFCPSHRERSVKRWFCACIVYINCSALLWNMSSFYWRMESVTGEIPLCKEHRPKVCIVMSLCYLIAVRLLFFFRFAFPERQKHIVRLFPGLNENSTTSRSIIRSCSKFTDY